MNQHNSNQRLFWSMSRPLKYLGLTPDEWGVTLPSIFGGLWLLNNGAIKYGFLCMIGGVVLCYLFKKYKRLSQNFKLRSFLVAKGFILAPSSHPRLLGKRRVGR
ncbi:hypothetical protein OAP56_00275 [Rickettsiaceae bacterium]|nr:hypothetical protein [Rickettsiaceae bacterium]